MSTGPATCPLCASATARPLIEADYNLTGATREVHRVVECAACRFRYTWPRPGPDELAKFYTEDYPAHALGHGGVPSVEAGRASADRRLRRVADLRIALIRRFLGRPIDGLRVLDVGCGGGAFLLELAKRERIEGWGLDIAGPALEALGRARPDLRLVRGHLGEADLPKGYFDVITLWHVLEHDPDPVAALRRIVGWLRPGGLLMAEVPDASGRIARLCGRDWLGWDLPRHLVHFGSKTLRNAAERAGLTHARVVRAYTLNPLCMSPVLASLALGHRRRRGKTRMKRVRYETWDRIGPRLAISLVNGIERALGGNGLLLIARAPAAGGGMIRPSH